MKKTNSNNMETVEMAVIGMAGRFPGAQNIDQFWENLKNGAEGITFFSREELLKMDVNPEWLDNPDYSYVPAKGVLPGHDLFDAYFFGYTPAEAQIMDPQMRIFHECAWEALENAGYNPLDYQGAIGLFAGATPNPFWEVLPLHAMGNTSSGSGKDYPGLWNAIQFSDKDYLSTRIAYKLNLKGPCVSLQTACSTSLTAVEQACRNLLGRTCDMALAGGISVTLHDEAGYLYQEGTIMSPDGHCRAFDARARGTVGGNGAGIIVLKRLPDAIADNDHIMAVIKGLGITNDGSNKLGFTAPSSLGQARAIRSALDMAGFSPQSIGYIETHGTGTPLGDPVEIEGLKKAFNVNSANYTKSCALGSVKTNIGHLDAAAGIAGLIKTVLALFHRLIPPSLHFEKPNPALDLENSPFYVNTELKTWERKEYPLRAGVSSFGLGGVNVHVVMEEYISDGQEPFYKKVPGPPKIFYYLLPLSAVTSNALEQLSANLVQYFERNPDIDPADAAYTLQVGRNAFKHRRTLICTSLPDAVQRLNTGQFEDDTARTENPTDTTQDVPIFNMLQHPEEETTDVCYMLSQVGRLWMSGVNIDWPALHTGEKRKRIPLPSYPFERNSYPPAKNLFKLGTSTSHFSDFSPHTTAELKKNPDIGASLYTPTWQRSTLFNPKIATKAPRHQVTPRDYDKTNWYPGTMSPGSENFHRLPARAGTKGTALIVMDRAGIGLFLQKELTTAGWEVFLIANNNSIDDYKAGYYDDFIKELARQGKFPYRVFHLPGIDDVGASEIQERVDAAMARGFYSLLYLVQALGKHHDNPLQILYLDVVTGSGQEVTGEEELRPGTAPFYGLCKVIPQEYPFMRCRCSDILAEEKYESPESIEPLLKDLTAGFTESAGTAQMVAYRGNYRWVQSFKPLRLEKPGLGDQETWDSSLGTVIKDLAMTPAEKREYYPLAPAQKRMFILNRMAQDSTAYNITSMIELHGEVNREKFQDIFRRIIRRHESLRTSFTIINEEPVQRIHDQAVFNIEFSATDAFGVHGQTRTHNVENLLKSIQSFDLTQAPLLRVILKKEDEKRHILMLDMHHIISDGTSMGVLIKDFIQLYKGETPPPPAIQYKDYACMRHYERNTGQWEKQALYWQRELAGVLPVLNLPLDFPRPPQWDFAGRQCGFVLEKAETAALKALARTNDVTLYMVLLSVYTIMLARLTGQEELLLGAPMAGRGHADILSVIGMFINTLVLRCFPVMEKPYGDYLSELKTLVLAGLENQDYPFEDLVEQMALSREVGRNPLFDAAFVLQNMDVPEINIPGLTLIPHIFDNGAAKLDISLIAEELNDTLRFTFEYRTSLFAYETMERFAGYFKQIAASVIAGSGEKLGNINMVSSEEKTRLLEEFNNTRAIIPGTTLPGLFQQQVEQTPDRVALVGAGEAEEKKSGVEPLRAASLQITYFELNEQSDRLAGILSEKGVLPDTIVGIMMERSINLIIGIWSILKAGGAYLPIDPSYPRERIQYMVQDSKAEIIVNNEFLMDAPQAPFL
ncbi:MAG: condensation domain-containing protein, partial [Acidobacteria bacterium]|nr:condensation domain-containing protein [Acidobacteriota bacterium]